MTSTRDEDLDLFDFVWERFRTRMAGLDDVELSWSPTGDSNLTLRWRLAHIAEMLAEQRNAVWLGIDASTTTPGTAGTRAVASAEQSLDELGAAYTQWRAQLSSVADDDLAAPIGAGAGPYGSSSRQSFVLHIADELIHHAAEAALFRDLYAARSPGGFDG